MAASHQDAPDDYHRDLYTWNLNNRPFSGSKPAKKTTRPRPHTLTVGNGRRGSTKISRNETIMSKGTRLHIPRELAGSPYLIVSQREKKGQCSPDRQIWLHIFYIPSSKPSNAMNKHPCSTKFPPPPCLAPPSSSLPHLHIQIPDCISTSLTLDSSSNRRAHSKKHAHGSQHPPYQTM